MERTAMDQTFVDGAASDLGGPRHKWEPRPHLIHAARLSEIWGPPLTNTLGV